MPVSSASFNITVDLTLNVQIRVSSGVHVLRWRKKIVSILYASSHCAHDMFGLRPASCTFVCSCPEFVGFLISHVLVSTSYVSYVVLVCRTLYAFFKKEPVFGNLCMTPKTRTKTKVPTVRSVLFVRQFRSRMGPRKRGFEELILGCQCSHFVAIRFGKISLSMLFCLRHGADQFYSFIISSSCVSGTHPGQSLSRNSKYDLPPSILKWCCSISCVHISNDIPG